MRGDFFLANVLLCSWQSARQLYFFIHAQRNKLLLSLFLDIEIFPLFTVSTTLATCCFIRGSWEQMLQNIGLPSPSETEVILTHSITFTCALAAACLLMHFSKHDLKASYNCFQQTWLCIWHRQFVSRYNLGIYYEPKRSIPSASHISCCELQQWDFSTGACSKTLRNTPASAKPKSWRHFASTHLGKRMETAQRSSNLDDLVTTRKQIFW